MQQLVALPRFLGRLGRFSFALTAFVVLVAAAPAPIPGGSERLSLVDSPTDGAAIGSLLDGIGPLLLIGLAIAIAIFVVAGVILFRTRASAAPAPSPEDWWTCSTCSAGNLEGTARCHACGTWRSANARPTPSASR